ncbi:MAG: putative geopeptide radical SAM maturase [Nitrospiraceae bacterium]|nr:MAG: putative geopeptide radical SAM maturase [Nitrospiraceae bacterium]
MKLSRYLKIYPFDERPGYLLLYSTKKSSKILLREETYDSIINGTLSPENEATLSRLGMIVSDLELERREVLGLIDEINAKNARLNLSVIMNLDCNFNCVYCYEGGMKGKFYMTDETAGLLLDFVKDRFTPGKKTIHMDFYGGEPLLSANLIKSISMEMKSFAESRGARYTFTLVTNGSLLKRRIAEELTSLGLKGVKMTLDGPPEIHNSCRPFKSGAGSFDAIVENIKETHDLLKIGIGGNYRKDNFEKFPLLFDYLEREGLTPGRIHELKFEPVMNRPVDENSPDYMDGLMSVNEPWVISAGAFLRGEVLRRGYGTPKINPSPCQVEINDSYVVNFDGVIYKCPVFIGKKGFETGDLRNGVTDYSDSHRPGIYKNDECAECGYLPLCFGGCRYMSYVRNGNVESVDCKRPYFDAVLETMIKQDIKFLSSRSTKSSD